MLRGIDPLLGPELLYTLAAMGHGDELVVADRNFPAMSCNARVHRLDGVGAVPAIAAILSVLPLDGFVASPLRGMQIDGEVGALNEVQQEVLGAAEQAAGRRLDYAAIDRHEFYDVARSAYAVVATGEDRPYGCFVLTKGIIPEIGPYIS